MNRILFEIYLPGVKEAPWYKKIFLALALTSIEAFLSILCLTSGLPILLNPEKLAPNSVLTLFPGWSIYLWAGGLVVGGSISLLGIVSYQYRLERIGILLLAATVGCFSLALLPLLPSSLAYLTTFILFTAAMASRYWLLGKLIQMKETSVTSRRFLRLRGRL